MPSTDITPSEWLEKMRWARCDHEWEHYLDDGRNFDVIFGKKCKKCKIVIEKVIS